MDAERQFLLKEKTLKDFFDLINTKKQQLEEGDDAIRISGPFYEGRKVICILKLIRPGGQHPDELHQGFIKGISEIQGIRIIFQVGEFPDSQLYTQIANELLIELGVRILDNREMPNPPPENAPHNDFFDYYHLVKYELKFYYTLRELAKEMFLSYGYVRHLHSDYLKDHNTNTTQE